MSSFQKTDYQQKEEWQKWQQNYQNGGNSAGSDTSARVKREADFFFGIIIGFFKFIFESLTTSFELIIRKNFGERYFTPLKFIFGLFIIANLAIGVVIVDFESSQNRYPSTGTLPGFSIEKPQTELFQNPFSEEELEEYKETRYLGRFVYDLPNKPVFATVFFALYAIAYILFGLSEFRRQFERARDGKPWHSYNTGQSRVNFLNLIIRGLRLKSLLGKHMIANHVNQLYIEPLFCLCVGLALMLFLPVIGGYVTVGSILVFIRGQIIFHRVKKQILDIKDSKIETKFMAQAIKGADPANTAGMTIMSIRPEFSSNGVGTTEAMGKAFVSNPSLAKIAGIDIEDKDKESIEQTPDKSKVSIYKAQKIGEKLFEDLKKDKDNDKAKASKKQIMSKSETSQNRKEVINKTE